VEEERRRKVDISWKDDKKEEGTIKE